MKRILCLVLSLCLVLPFLSSCGKQNATTMRLMKTQGDVGVLDDKGESVPVRRNIGLYSGYHVATQVSSMAWINLDDVKLAKMDEDSEIEIRKAGKSLEMTVNAGAVFFNVTKPLEDDESLKIRTSTIVAGIRGTSGWIEYISEDAVRLSLLEGKVECSAQNKDGEAPLLIACAGQQCEFDIQPDGSVTYTVEPLSEIPAFVTKEVTKISGLTVTEEDFEKIKGMYSHDFQQIKNQESGGYFHDVTCIIQVGYRNVFSIWTPREPNDRPLIDVANLFRSKKLADNTYGIYSFFGNKFYGILVFDDAGLTASGTTQAGRYGESIDGYYAKME